MKSTLRLPRFTLLLLCLTLLLGGCDSNDILDGPLTAIELTPGTTYTYEAIFETVIRDFDGIIIESTLEQDTFLFHVANRSEEIAGFENLIQIEEFDPMDPGLKETTWYIQNDSQLVAVAHRSGGYSDAFITPKRMLSFERFILVRNQLEGQVTNTPDRINIRPDPRIVAVFPLESGNRWTSFSDPFLQVREVTGSEILRVPPGEYFCVVVRTQILEEDPSSGYFIDHLSTEGLIQRLHFAETEARDRQNNPIGTMTFSNRYTLIRRER